MTVRTVLAGSCLLLAAPLAAQASSGGPLVATPAAVIAGRGTLSATGTATSTPLKTNRLQTKKPGFSHLKRLAWNSSQPDFGKVFEWQGLTVEVDAISLGEDQIAADCGGVIQLPPGAWNTMEFAVDSATRGEPGSVVEREARGPGGASADILSYVIPGSNLPAGVGETERSMDSTELGLKGTTGPGQIAALDAFIPIYRLPLLSGLLTRTPTVYFSLTRSSAAQVPSWFAGRIPSGATILQTTWDRRGFWSLPKPFAEYRDLGLLAGDEVDALAYDRSQNMVLYSTDNAPVEQQLKIVCLTGDNPAVADYEEPGGKKVAVSAGAGQGGNITAVCTIDPARSAIQQYQPFAWGTWQNALPLPFPPDLQAASYRTCGGPGKDAHYSVMIGWPGGVARPGRAWLLLNAGSVWVALGPYARNPANPIAGDPIESPALPLPAIYGVNIKGLWLAVDSGLTTAAASYPIEIRL